MRAEIEVLSLTVWSEKLNPNVTRALVLGAHRLGSDQLYILFTRTSIATRIRYTKLRLACACMAECLIPNHRIILQDCGVQ